MKQAGGAYVLMILHDVGYGYGDSFGAGESCARKS